MHSKKTVALIAMSTLALSTAAEPPTHGEHAAPAKTAAAPAKTPPVSPKAQSGTASKAAAKATPTAAAEDRTYSADEALSMLMEGNERWVANRVDAPSTSPDLSGHLVEFLRTPRRHDKVGTGIGETEGDPVPDPPAGSRHHGDPSIETEQVHETFRHRPLLCQPPLRGPGQPSPAEPN